MGEAENSKYCEMLQEHLGALTSYGRVFLASIEGAAAILEQDYLGISHLSDDQKKEFFRMLRDNATKYNDLIVSNFQERERFAAQEAENCEVEQEFLALLTTSGIENLAFITEGAELLENAYLGIVELLAEQKKELFSMLKNRARQFNNLITWSIQERQKFI